MNYDEYELMLFDRIEVIKQANKKYDLENNAYISFSGGKDSTVLHHLMDIALPNNRIPRVFINTGIEYLDIVRFVKELAEKDDRFVMITPNKPIKKVLEEYGYPFKSKEHSHFVGIYQRSGRCKSVKMYLDEYEGGENYKRMTCPKSLKYQFTPEFGIKLSEKCCDKLKKEPSHKWQKENKKPIAIIGIMMNEGGQRASHSGCVITDKDGKMVKFKPLNPISKEWEEEFIRRENVKLCKLYYPPFNFKRTGCKGCPFSLELQDQLTTMEIYLPAERKQCEAIWKPVYDEYRRIGYRLDKDEQLKLF